MIKKLNDSLEKYQKEMSDLNNGERILIDIGNSLKEIVNNSVEEANSTDSIDKRIESLVGGLQSVLRTINEKQQVFFRDRAVLEIKIEALEDVLLSDIDAGGPLDVPEIEE